jgi:hypothetical protein
MRACCLTKSSSCLYANASEGVKSCPKPAREQKLSHSIIMRSIFICTAVDSSIIISAYPPKR